MDNLNESLKEAVCIEEEVFFGPIADKERKIREQFENVFMNENKTVESHLNVENDISRNDSLYKSFSVDESRYDSFDDSLNEENKPQEAKHITLRKSFNKLKPKRHGFYDSLEDVCSLVSNIDKCSISCEVDNSNLNNKQHIIEDSLKNPPVAVENKSNGANEQVHFDDDSLAILELENTFDDSLEEINDVCVLSNIEIEEIEDIENMTAEHQNLAIKVEQSPSCFPRNLFDSVEVVYEAKWGSDVTDQEESSDDKNLLYDSLSNSDFKDILKDSLEESGKFSESINFLKPISANAVTQKSEGMVTGQNVLDTSVQIIYENFQNVCRIGNNSEKTNSEYNEFSKDSLESCKNVEKDSAKQTNTEAVNEGKLRSSNMNSLLSKSPSENTIASKENYENFLTGVADSVIHSDSNANEKVIKTDSIIIDPVPVIPVSAVKEDRDNKLHSDSNANQNFKIMKDTSVVTETLIPVCDNGNGSNNVLHSKSNANQNYKIKKDTSVVTETVIPVSDIGNDSNNVLHSDSNANQNSKITKDTSVIAKPVIPISTIDNTSHKEAFSVDSCHLKLLSDDLNADKDMKFELHLEVTVGDKKCQIASQEIKVLSTTDADFRKYENELQTCIPSGDHVSEKKDTLDNSISKLNNDDEECNVVREVFACNEAVSKENICEMSKSVASSNITHRPKSSKSHLVSDLEGKVNFSKNLSNISLLQALDLHDMSFLNESIIQSNDSLMPLNLCCKDVYSPLLRDECKENVPQPLLIKKKNFNVSNKKASPIKITVNKTPKQFQKSPGLKDSSKKLGTKIPVRNFAVPAATPAKPGKQVPTAISTEKVNKCQPSPRSASKKTPVSTPNKTPHFCKVRNTIFSKVPQIVPSKKYMNIQSPVAEYIKNIHGSGKTPHFNPVLRDCRNHPLESPYHSHLTPKSGTLKSTIKKV